MTSESTATRPAEGGVVTFYQPFYNLGTGDLQGVEALARRRESSGEAQLPAALAGEDEVDTVTPRDIDLFILDDALASLARWTAEHDHADLKLSVNLSVEFSTHPAMISDIVDALARHGVAPDRLLLDLSVDAYRRTTDDTTFPDHVRAVQEAGITTCLDGFTIDDLDVLEVALLSGVDIVKLHPSQPGVGEELLAYVAEKVHEQGIPVVAAGVETQEQLDLSRRLDFAWAQGYLICEPVEGDAVLAAPSKLSS